MKELSYLVRSMRRHRGWTQQELAKAEAAPGMRFGTNPMREFGESEAGKRMNEMVREFAKEQVRKWVESERIFDDIERGWFCIRCRVQFEVLRMPDCPVSLWCKCPQKFPATRVPLTVRAVDG